MNPLLGALGEVGYAMDTPGAYLRGVLGGRPGERMGGRDMLESWGAVGANQDGLDAGDVAGFGVDLLADPLNWLGGAGIHAGTKAARALGQADDAGPLARAIGGFVGGEEGALKPFQEIGRRADPDFVNSQTWFHGNRTPGLKPGDIDAQLTKAENLLGPGFYNTESPVIAHGYTRPRGRSLKGSPRVYAVGTDYGKILDANLPVPPDVLDILRNASAGLDSYDNGYFGFLPEFDQYRKSLPDPTTFDLWRQLSSQASDLSQAGDVPYGEIVDHFFDLGTRLRESGIDALTHTGGLGTRAGRAHGPHQVLVGLDPNDLYSQVGRANQIRFLKEIHPDSLAELLNWDRRGL